jgi:CheY-like chemotaxis protein
MASPSLGQIVVIDDNEDLADLFGELLVLLGYQVHVAHSGLVGLELSRRFLPQVVFCDINMPGIGGLEVSACIRREGKRQSPLLVAVTAWSGITSHQEILAAGFDVHLVKPVDFEVITVLLTEYFKSISA